jgi:hypothetical protein
MLRVTTTQVREQMTPVRRALLRAMSECCGTHSPEGVMSSLDVALDQVSESMHNLIESAKYYDE